MRLGESLGQVTPRRSALWIIMVILAMLLAACGTPEASTRVVALVEPTATRTPLPPTMTPPPTLVPTATATRAFTPTATLPPASPTQVLPPGSYSADWTLWPVGEEPGKNRRIYDRAKNEYRLAVLEDNKYWTFYLPEKQTYQNFVVETEAYQTAGPPATYYGITFRRLPLAAGAQSREQYFFSVSGQGLFRLARVDKDGTTKAVKDLGPGPPGVIMVGNAPNRLTVTAKDRTITLAVNGQTVYTLANATINGPGEIGIHVLTSVGSFEGEAAFKYLRISPAP